MDRLLNGTLQKAHTDLADQVELKGRAVIAPRDAVEHFKHEQPPHCVLEVEGLAATYQGFPLLVRGASAPPRGRKSRSRKRELAYVQGPGEKQLGQSGWKSHGAKGFSRFPVSMLFHSEPQAHRDELRGDHAGNHLAIEGETIVASGQSLPDVVERARKLGIPSPFVYYVEEFSPQLGF